MQYFLTIIIRCGNAYYSDKGYCWSIRGIVFKNNRIDSCLKYNTYSYVVLKHEKRSALPLYEMIHSGWRGINMMEYCTVEVNISEQCYYLEYTKNIIGHRFVYFKCIQEE